MDSQRRLFLQRAARLAAISVTGATLLPISGIANNNWYPFRLGIASGAPLPNAVVLWTRILSEPAIL